MKYFKKVKLSILIAILLVITSVITGCDHHQKRGCSACKADKKSHPSHSKKGHKKSCCPTEKKGIAVIKATKGNNVSGTILFHGQDAVVNITGNISGLNPNQKHGIHIHEFGDISAKDAMSAGGHYNPKNMPHSLPDSKEKHFGDLGNLQADGKGNATLSLSLSNNCLFCRRHSIIGRSVIIHEKEDDGGQPVGNAGARIGAGVIGLAK